MTDLTYPTFLASLTAALGSVIAAIVGGVLAWLAWRSNHEKKKMAFREDYRKEIDSVLDCFYNFLSSRSWTGWALQYLFQSDARMSKRILQHLYTCSDTKFLYDLVKNMTEKIYEQEKQGVNSDKINYGNFAGEFHEKFHPIWDELKNYPNADFGACEKCIKDIKLKHVKKHKKFLKNSDPKMWSLFEPHSR